MASYEGYFCPGAIAVGLPVEERIQRSRRLEQSVRAGAVHPPPAHPRDRRHAPTKGAQKSRQARTPDREWGSGKKHAPRSAPGPPSSLTGTQGDTQLQILAAVPGLSERLCMVEAQLPSTVA